MIIIITTTTGGKLGAVAHACNSSYSGGRDQKTIVGASPGKKFMRHQLNQ
jgi:hypothetical protein